METLYTDDSPGIRVGLPFTLWNKEDGVYGLLKEDGLATAFFIDGMGEYRDYTNTPFFVGVKLLGALFGGDKSHLNDKSQDYAEAKKMIGGIIEKRCDEIVDKLFARTATDEENEELNRLDDVLQKIQYFEPLPASLIQKWSKESLVQKQ